MVGKPTLVEVFEHGEGMRPDGWQERIGGPVKELDRRQVGLEVAVTNELLDGFRPSRIVRVEFAISVSSG